MTNILFTIYNHFNTSSLRKFENHYSVELYSSHYVIQTKQNRYYVLFKDELTRAYNVAKSLKKSLNSLEIDLLIWQRENNNNVVFRYGINNSYI